MTITKDNTRVLGVGETLLPTDYIEIDGRIEQIGEPTIGYIVSSEDPFTFRRSLVGDPYELMFAELGLKSQDAKKLFRHYCAEIVAYDKQLTEF